MSREKSQSGGKNNSSGTPWFSTPDNAPPKNPKEIELSLSSISDSSSSNRRRRIQFLTSIHADRVTPDYSSTETNDSTRPSAQQNLRLFSEQEETSAGDAPHLTVSPSWRSTSTDITLLREDNAKTYIHIAQTLPARKFFRSKDLVIQPSSPQRSKAPAKRILKKRRGRGCLYSLHMPLGWMTIHGVAEEIRKELHEEYSYLSSP